MKKSVSQIADRFLTIQQSADLLHVATKTLRRWEEKGILIPQRSEGGHRRYLRQEVIDFKKQFKPGKHNLTATVTGVLNEEILAVKVPPTEEKKIELIKPITVVSNPIATISSPILKPLIPQTDSDNQPTASVRAVAEEPTGRVISSFKVATDAPVSPRFSSDVVPNNGSKSVRNSVTVPQLYQQLHTDQKRVLRRGAILSALIMAIFVLVKLSPVSAWPFKNIQSKNTGRTAELAQAADLRKMVLGDVQINDNLVFKINVPTHFGDQGTFDKDVQVQGTVTAGELVAAGNVAANGGAFTTTAPTVNLVNTGATTVNLAGAAAQVTIGSTAGQTQINNALNVADISKIKNVAYSFPTTQGASATYLQNDGAGKLTWQTITVPTQITDLSQMTGTLAVGHGGTGSTSFSGGSIIFSDGSKLTENNSNFFWDSSNQRLGVLTNSPAAALSVGTGSPFQVDTGGAIAAVTGYTQSSGNFLVSGPASTVTISSLAAAGGVVTVDGIGKLGSATAGTIGQCLLSNGSSSPTWGSCSGSIADIPWLISNGVIFPANNSLDLLVGGSTTASAKFALKNVNAGVPTFQINGTDVLTQNTLGAGVTGSSLTGVGALNSGSIANGFGTITTANTITGTTVNGTAGVNTGAGSGTQRIDASGNLVNIGSITANGAITAPTSANTINGLVISSGVLSNVNGFNQAGGNFAIAGNGTFNTGTGAVNLNGNTTITGSNSFTVAALNTAGGVVYTNGSGTLSTSASGTAGLCLISGGTGTPTWTSCSGVAGNQFQSVNGSIAALNSTQDFLIGGQSSASAKFGLVNVNSGTPAVQISGTTVLTATSLGSGVTGSSLTGVGALNSGSIANGFGTITTANAITGTTVNGTTGVNTGAGAGTQRVDAGGNLVNIANVNASGAITFSGLNAAAGLLYTNGSGVVAQTAQGAANTLLHGNGSGAPTWSGVDLTADVLNVLPINHGGTNSSATPTSGALAYGTGTAYAFMSANATSGLCLTSGGSGAPTWVNCASVAGNQFQSLAGAIVPNNSTQDLLVGGQSSASAKFGLVNVNSGAPALQINGATVLTATGLGAGVTGSSLTGVGALNSGSIANGFGTITTANTITGTTVNGTAGVNTGAGSGTQRIDASGNLVNIGSITAATASNTINGIVINAGAVSGVTGYTQNSGNFTINGGGSLSTGNGNISLNGNTTLTGATSLTIAALNTAGGLMYTSGSGVVNTSIAGISGQCLISGGSGAPSWAGCSGAAGNQFQVLNGTIVPLNNTQDFLIGGQSSASAKFGLVNVNSGAPALQINGTTVLTATGLGSGVTGSSLTGVGALNSGSIASGFGTITTSNNITGTAINGTVGVNTGVGAGIQRIDTTGSLVNINNLTATGSATLTMFNIASGLLYTNSSGTFAQTAQGASHTVLHGNGSVAPSWSGVDLTADVLNLLPISSGGTNGTATPTAGALAYGTGTAYAFMSANSTSGLCLTSGGAGAPTWSNCSGVSGNVFQGLNGAIQAINSTQDFLIGGSTTASAKFAVLNVNSGSPTASISGASGSTYLTATGTLQTTNNQSLVAGGATTGNILLQPGNGTGRVGINTLTPRYTLDVNGTLSVNSAALFANNVGVSGAATLSGSLTANGGAAITGGLNAGGGQTFAGGLNNSGAGITNAGSITGGTGITSSGTITLSGLSSGVVHAGIGGVLSSSAVNLAGGSSEVTGTLAAINGGTGLSSYATGDLIFASATNTLSTRSIGATNQVLTVAGGVPTWATISGAGGICPDCIVSDPNSTQVLQATSSAATGLSIRQPAGGSVDIFNVTDSTGSNKYFRVDSAGNVILGSGSSTGVFTINPAGTDPIALSPVANNGTAYTGSITSATLTQAQAWTFPNQTGTVCLSSGNCLTGGTGISGSGTINHLAKFQSSTGLTDSLLYDDGTNIGIANGSPLYKLDLNGTFHVTGGATLSNNLGVAGSATISGNLITSGATSLQSTLGVSGAATLSSTLNVTGAAVLNSTLGVTGNTTVGSNTFFVDTTGNQVGVGTGAPGNLFSVGSGSPFQVNSAGQIAAITGYTQGSGNFAISGGGTFGTGTGAISLNGNTTVASGKNLTLAGLNTAGAVVYTDISGTLNATSQGLSGNCLLSGGATSPTWGSCTSTANTQWTIANGAIYATNPTVDLLIGGSSTASAQFDVNATNGNVLAKGYVAASGASFSATVAGNVPLTVKGATGQTANLANYQNVGGTSLFAVDSVGNLALTAGGKLYPFTDSTTAINIANAGGTAFTTFDSSNSRVGILTSAPAAALSVGASNQFQVNSSGAIAAATGLTSSGSVTFSNLNTNNGLFYANGSGLVAQTAQGAANTILHGNGAGVPTFSAVDLTADVSNTLTINHGGTNGTASPTAGALAYGTGTAYAFMSSNSTAGLCLVSGGSGSPTWSSCAGASGALFQSLNGSIVPINNTEDFLVGGQASASAKFGLVNVNSGSPAIQINGTTVLTGTNLGTGVTGSSLTGVGALSSGSIASGFGTITTANNITGTAINGTVGINTGAGTGTQRLDGAGNLINIGNLTATGTATLANYNTNNGLLFTNGSGVVAQTAQGAVNTILHGNGSSAPSWSGVDLTADVLNTLPINHGGTNGTATPTAGAIAYGTGTAYAFMGANATSGLCLVSGGSGTPSWGSCAAAVGGTSPFQVLAGAIVPFNSTEDFLIGSSSTTSAKFAVLNVNSGTPTASISGSSAGNALSLNGDGTISTSLNRSLALNPNGGNVGIGTSTPQYALDVNSTSTIGSIMSRGKINETSNEKGVQIGYGPANDSPRFWLGDGNSSQNWQIDNNGGTMRFFTPGNTVAELGGGTNYFGVNGSAAIGNSYYASAGPTNGLAVQGSVGIGNTNPSSALSVGASSQFQVNSSGAIAAATGITSSGTITLSGFSTNNGLLYTNGSGIVGQTAQGAANTILHGNGTSAPSWSGVDLTADVINILPINRGGTNGTATPTAGALAYGTGTAYAFMSANSTSGFCLTSGGSGAPTWGSCAGAAGEQFQSLNGSIVPVNSTQDFMIGGQSTASAKFAFLNVNSGTPTASVSGATGAMYLTATGTLATTAKQALALGDANTGNIYIPSTSNLGIGTSTPGAPLSITTGYSEFERVVNLSGSAYTSYNTSGASSGYIGLESNSGGGMVAGDTATDLVMMTTGTGAIRFAPNASIAMSVLLNGHVGVGGTAGTSLFNVGASDQFQVNSSGAIAAATGINSSGSITFSGLNTAGGVVYTNGSGTLATVGGIGGQCLISGGAGSPVWSSCAAAAGGVSPFQALAGVIMPFNSTQDFMIGGQSTASAKFAFLNVNSGTPTATISGSSAGNALGFTGDGILSTSNNRSLILNPNGGNVGIGTSTALAKLDVQGANVTSTNGIAGTFNGLTTGFGLAMTSSSTALTTGGLASFDWSPGSSTIASGDLVSLNVGANGTLSNIFNVKNNGSSVFSVSQNQITANLPTSFTAPGDVSMAYDLNFTNPTGSFIKSTAPLTLLSGESFNSDNLTLSTFNSGHVVLDSAAGVIITNLTTQGGIPYISDTIGTVSETAQGIAAQCLLSGGSGAPTWGSCAAAAGGTSPFQTLAGSIMPNNTTLDFLIGGQSSASAHFAVLNVNSGTPIASLSASGASGFYFTASGSAQTTGRQSLVLGGGTTGNISINNTLNTPFGYFDTLNSRLGLGITNPTDQLTVFSNINDQGIQIQGAAPTISPTFRFANLAGTIYSRIGIAGYNAALTNDSAQYDTVIRAETQRILFTTNNGASSALSISPNGGVGIGTNSAQATLDVRANSGTLPVASISGKTANAGLIVDNSGIGDIFTASDAGATKFTVNGAGNVIVNNLNTAGGIVYTSATGQLGTTAQGVATQCLLSAGASAPTWGTCTSAANVFQITSGAINTLNSTEDFLVGGQSTASAKFAVLNVNSGTPTASLSASGASGFYFTASGSAQTTGRQTLALGGGTTGNISINNILNTPFATFDTTNSRLGIGTTAPNSTLSISNANTSTPVGGALSSVTLDNSDISANSMNGFLSRMSDAGGSLRHSGAIVFGKESSWVAASGNYPGYTAFYTRPSGGDETERLRLTSGGSLGLNTTSPLATLDVRNVLGTAPTASFSGATSFAGMLVDNSGIGDLFTASKSGATKFVINNAGNVGIGNAAPTALLDLVNAGISTTNGISGAFNGLTSGIGLAMSSNSTVLTTGGLASFDWSPGSATTATGDLVSLNVGANGTIGNIFNIKNAGSSVFSVSQNQITANLPTAFNAAGDIGAAYDLQFTNPTASFIKSTAPLTLQAGETFNSSDLTLRTFNNGDLILDNPGGVVLAQAQNWTLASSSAALNFGSNLLNLDTTNNRVGIGTSSAIAALDVVDQTNAGFALHQFNNSDGAVMRLMHAGGTIAAPTALTANSDIFGIRGFGATSANTYSSAAAHIDAYTAENFTSTNQGTYLRLATTALGTNVALERMRIDSNGAIGIGTAGAAELGTLDVRSVLGTIPVASFSGSTSFATLLTDNSGIGDLFTASKSGATKFVINNAGNVGIGTNAPGTKLTIAQSGVSYAEPALGTGTGSFSILGDTGAYGLFGGVVSNGNTWLQAMRKDSTATAYNLELNPSGGFVGVGTTTPKFGLDVQNNQGATYAAMVTNTNNGATTGGLAIKLAFTNAGASTNFYQGFYNGNGQLNGVIRSNAANGVSYSTNGIDLAEYFTKEDANATFPTGTLMCQGLSGVRACLPNDFANIVGIVSEHPAFLGGVEGPNKVVIALTGQVPMRVNSTSGVIKSGDPISFSNQAGVGSKITHAGSYVGTALADYTNNDPTQVGTVMVYVHASYTDPDSALTTADTKNYSLSQMIDGSFIVNTPVGQLVDKVVTASDAVIGNLTAGKITAKSIQTDSLQIGSLSLDQYIAQVVSGLSVNTASGSANASSSGTLASGSTATVSATIASSVQTMLATNSAQIASGAAQVRVKLADLNTTANDVVINANALYLSQYFETAGNAFIGNNLGVNNSAVFGKGLVVNDAGIEFLNTVATADQKFNLLGVMQLDAAGQVSIKGDLTVHGRITTDDPDVAGFAQVKAGDSSVAITFTRPYATVPVITATPDDSATQFTITKKSANGFTLQLKAPATADTTFNWTAISILSAKTFMSPSATVSGQVAGTSTSSGNLTGP